MKVKHLKLGMKIGFILLLVGLGATLLIPFTNLEKSNIKWPVILELSGIVLILLFGQRYGQRIIDKNDKRFWIPRQHFGWGVGVNPHNRGGKIITYSLIFSLFFLIMLFIFIPNHFYH